MQRIQQVVEALAFLADAVVVGELQVVDEDLEGVVIDHRANRRGLQRRAGLRYVDQEQAKAIGLLLHRVGRRGARDQKVHVRVAVARSPDLLAVDDVATWHLARECLDRQRVGARVGLGHAEGLQPQATVGDARERRALLRFAAMAQDRRHRVHLRMAVHRATAVLVDLLQDQAGVEQRQPGAAVFLGNQRSQPAGLGHRVDEGFRIGAVLGALAPVLGAEALAQLLDGGADLTLGLGVVEVHGDLGLVSVNRRRVAVAAPPVHRHAGPAPSTPRRCSRPALAAAGRCARDGPAN